MAATEKAIQIAPKTDKKLKAKISRKLNKKSKKSDNPVADILISIVGVFLIIPCMIYGVFVFIGAGFKASLEAALKMYSEGIDNTKKWAR